MTIGLVPIVLFLGASWHQKRRSILKAGCEPLVASLRAGGFLAGPSSVAVLLVRLLPNEPVGPLPVAEQPAAHDLDYRTHFERRMRLHALPVYRSEFKKGI